MKVKTNLNQLANNLFEEIDKLEFDKLEKYVLNALRQHGFYETAHVSFSDGGLPSGNISRQAFYSPDLQAVVVVELSQDWDDFYNYETDSIEYREYYHHRVYIYNTEREFNDDDLYLLGLQENDLVFYYTTNNFNELYHEN